MVIGSLADHAEGKIDLVGHILERPIVMPLEVMGFLTSPTHSMPLLIVKACNEIRLLQEMSPWAVSFSFFFVRAMTY